MTIEARLPRAAFGSPDHPLDIAGIRIPCYVLDDGRRVLVQRGFQAGVGMSTGGGHGGARKIMVFLGRIEEKARLVKDITVRSQLMGRAQEVASKVAQPILFRMPTGGPPAFGYEATILADFCDVVLEARSIGLIGAAHAPVSDACELLVRGFARVGIIALVDEVTGYQETRDRKALQEILARYISADLLPWAKRFPDEFYRQMFRLRGWQFAPLKVAKPGVVGTLTNDLIYQRIAPGVLAELRRITPRGPSGRRKHKFHQRLTEDIGHPKLQEHIASVLTLMRASSSWAGLKRLADRALPKFGETLELPFDEPE